MKKLLASLGLFLFLAAILLMFAVARTDAHAATACVKSSSSPSQQFCDFGAYQVATDYWGGTGTETVTAYNYDNWSVQSSQSGSYPYPDVRRTESSLVGLQSSFKITMPSGSYHAEAAYDVWTGPNQTGDEIMVWVDNHGETSWGHPSTATKFNLDGKTWTREEGDSHQYVWLLDGSETSGTVSLGSMIKNSGGSSTVSSVQFGWELHQTSGQVFSVDSFSVS
jgi:hypothetical protein